MFRKVLRLNLVDQFGLRTFLKKKRSLKRETLVSQDVKKALMSADQNVIVMVRG